MNSPALRLVAGFEDGRVEHWECLDWSKRTDPRMIGARQGESSAGSGGWRNLWTQKVHNEAGTSSHLRNCLPNWADLCA